MIAPRPSRDVIEKPPAPLVSPEYQAIFDASPTPLLVIAPPDWIIVAANEARLKATDTTREQNLGRKLFDVFPDDPSHPEADGVQNLSASLERVLATKKADLMAVQRYALSDANGVFGASASSASCALTADIMRQRTPGAIRESAGISA